jgi:hypothetical protein
MNAIRRALPFLLSLAALTLVSPLAVRAWEMTPQGLQSVPLPASFDLVEPPAQADLNGDGLSETLRLADGHLAILSGTQAVWQSPSSWRVAQAAFSDLNRDGVTDVTMLVWRLFRPWPVDAWLPQGGRISEFHDAEGQSCHLILIGWKRGIYRELWAGSALAEPLRAFAVADLDADGKEELAALEVTYDDPLSNTASRLKVWEWNGFGFSAVYSLEGRFHQMQIVRAEDGRVLILSP